MFLKEGKKKKREKSFSSKKYDRTEHRQVAKVPSDQKNVLVAHLTFFFKGQA